MAYNLPLSPIMSTFLIRSATSQSSSYPIDQIKSTLKICGSAGGRTRDFKISSKIC